VPWKTVTPAPAPADPSAIGGSTVAGGNVQHLAGASPPAAVSGGADGPAAVGGVGATTGGDTSGGGTGAIISEDIDAISNPTGLALSQFSTNSGFYEGIWFKDIWSGHGAVWGTSAHGTHGMLLRVLLNVHTIRGESYSQVRFSRPRGNCSRGSVAA
jgi:hypothetical protein